MRGLSFRRQKLVDLVSDAAAKSRIPGLGGPMLEATQALTGITAETLRRRARKGALRVHVTGKRLADFCKSMQSPTNRFGDPAFDVFRDVRHLRTALSDEKTAKTVERSLRTLDANQRVIQCIEASRTSLLEKAKHDPVQDYLDVRVDRVQFIREGGEIRGGRYIRVSNAKGRPNGAVVLPIDLKTGDVLMVTQHRYAPDIFMTELPRGFGDLIDEDSRSVALRELEEETGHQPIQMNAKVLGDTQKEICILPLGSSYPDSGVLANPVSFFLAFVDREQIDSSDNVLRPSLESPVWVHLEDLFRAAILQAPVPIAYAERPVQWTQPFPMAAPIDDGILEVQDSFTFTALMAARPYLCRLYPKLRRQIAAMEKKAVEGSVGVVLSRLAEHL